MNNLLRSPFVVFSISFIVLSLSARIGAAVRKPGALAEEARRDLDITITAALTLLGLIIGFSFSMAVSRYDQRKIYEEDEANAIGTEYLRADLLGAAEAARVRTLLRDYIDQRILFYTTQDENELQQIAARTGQLGNQLWSAAQVPPAVQATPVVALAVSGMNDVLNSQGYTQAAWWNRIPAAAWALMVAIAVCSNLLVGYGARRARTGLIQLLVLPLILSIAFFLIADIDSPRRGLIRLHPQNLTSFAQSFGGR
jgi:hypothetical protein